MIFSRVYQCGSLTPFLLRRKNNNQHTCKEIVYLYGFLQYTDEDVPMLDISCHIFTCQSGTLTVAGMLIVQQA